MKAIENKNNMQEYKNLSSWDVIGHKSQVDYLKSNIYSDDLAHAYLFSGEEQIGKRKIALLFIKTIMCEADIKPCEKCTSCAQIEKNIHPDVSVLDGLESIKMESIKELISKISLKPFNSHYKIALIDNAERLTIESSNALLKTLEEPTGQTIIILITKNSSILLPTIVSRSRMIKFFKVNHHEIEKIISTHAVENHQEELLTKIAIGKPGKIFEILKNTEELEETKNNLNKFFDILKGDRVENLNYSARIAEQYEKNPKSVVKLFNFWMIILMDMTKTEILPDYESNLSEQYRKIDNIKCDLNNLVKALKFLNNAQEMISNPKSGLNIKLIIDLIILKIEKIKK